MKKVKIIRIGTYQDTLNEEREAMFNKAINEMPEYEEEKTQAFINRVIEKFDKGEDFEIDEVLE